MNQDLVTPNEHPIHDPAFWRGIVEKHAADYFIAADEVLQFGADLLMRIVSRGLDDVSDVVVAAALFRHALVAFDGALLTMREGAVDAALSHVRAQLETSLYIDWILRRGKGQQGEKYFVGSLRQELEWARRSMPGTPEHADEVEAWKAFGAEAPHGAEMERRAREVVKDIEARLDSERWRDCNRRFEEARGRRAKDPEWYSVPPDPVNNLFRMAETLGRLAEHRSLYRFASSRVHGSSLSAHAELRSDSGLTVKPVRYLDSMAMVFMMSRTHFVQTLHSLLSEYRPGELPNFREKWAAWVPRLRMPEFEMKRESQTP